MENIKEIESIINDYFINEQDTFIYDNYVLFFSIANTVCNIISNNIANSILDDETLINLPSYDIFQRLDFVRDYYSIFNIKDNLNELINNGTIELEGNEYQNDDKLSRSYVPITEGFSSKDIEDIRVNNTGTIIDSLVLVHELSHYKNRTPNERLIAREILTEPLAFAEKLIMADNIKNHDYEINIELQKQIITFYNKASYVIDILVFLLVYKYFGDISFESYKMVYKKDDYDKRLKWFKESIKINSLDNLNILIYYAVAALISPYLMYRVRENKEFMNKIQNAHEMVKHCKIEEALDYLEIDYNNINDFSKYLEMFCKEVKEKNNKLSVIKK